MAAKRRAMEIGYHLALEILRLCGWNAAVSALREAGCREEARGMFRALRDHADGRSLTAD